MLLLTNNEGKASKTVFVVLIRPPNYWFGKKCKYIDDSLAVPVMFVPSTPPMETVAIKLFQNSVHRCVLNNLAQRKNEKSKLVQHTKVCKKVNKAGIIRSTLMKDISPNFFMAILAILNICRPLQAEQFYFLHFLSIYFSFQDDVK